jgi:hypothetical protein
MEDAAREARVAAGLVGNDSGVRGPTGVMEASLESPKRKEVA